MGGGIARGVKLVNSRIKCRDEVFKRGGRVGENGETMIRGLSRKLRGIFRRRFGYATSNMYTE